MHQPKFFAWSPVWEVPPHIVNGEVGDAVHDVEELLHHHDGQSCSSLLNFQLDDVQSWLSLRPTRSPNINWQSSSMSLWRKRLSLSSATKHGIVVRVSLALEFSSNSPSSRKDLQRRRRMSALCTVFYAKNGCCNAFSALNWVLGISKL